MPLWGSGTIIEGTSPIAGGTDQQVQFNDGGVINGTTNFTFNKTTKRLVVGFLAFALTTAAGLELNPLTTTQRDALSSPVAGSLIWNKTTGSLDVYNGAAWSGAATLNALTDTWNNGGTTFQGISLNVSNGAGGSPVYNTGSYFLRLQFNGTTIFALDPTGIIDLTGGSTPSLRFGGSVPLQATNGTFYLGATGENISGASAFISAANSNAMQFGTANTIRVQIPNTGGGLILGANDAASPVAQALQVQSVVTGTSNTAGVDLTITLSKSTGLKDGGRLGISATPGGSTGTAVNSTVTAYLWPDAANILTLGNGANANVFRIYNTRDAVGTKLTNYERGFLDWSQNANVFTIGTESGGTGTARAITIQSAAAINITPASGSDTVINDLVSGNSLRYNHGSGNLSATGGNLIWYASGSLGWSGRGGILASADGVVALYKNDGSTFAQLQATWKSVAAKESTGGGSALLGTNCPAVTATAPYTWETVITSDGSVGYRPIWK